MRNKNIGMQNSTGRICWTIVGLWVMILMRITFADVGNETRTNDHRRLDARYQYHPLLEHCRDKGEAYAASFLVRKDFFLLSMERLILNREPVLGKPPSYSYDGEAWIKRRRELLKKSNIESATFSMMTHVTDQLLKESGREYDGGRIYQSIDVLDFSVLHLSTYERLLHRYSENLRVREGIEDYSAIEQATEVFKVKGLQRQRMEPVYKEGVIPSTLNHFQRTVVVMPYLGHEQGEGNSKIMYRQRYLAACFWSYYAYYPHIVVVVSSVIDRDYVLKQSGLPFFDVIYVPELPSPSSLPFAAVMAAARRMSTSTPKQPDQDDVSSSSPSSPSSSSSSSSSLGAKKLKKTMWRTQFDFIFYTESDQMLVARSEDRLSEFYKAIKRDPSRRWDQDFMLSPHRLTVYPKVVLQHIYKFPATEIQQLPFIPVQGKPGEVLLMGDPSEKGTATTMPRRDLQSSMVKPQVVARSDVDYHVDWQCCQQPSQMCRRPRDHWAVMTSNGEKRRQHPYHTAPALVSLFHPQLYIALGNVDFHYERFHGCTLTGFINRDRQQDLRCPNV